MALVAVDDQKIKDDAVKKRLGKLSNILGSIKFLEADRNQVSNFINYFRNNLSKDNFSNIYMKTNFGTQFCINPITPNNDVLMKRIDFYLMFVES